VLQGNAGHRPLPTNEPKPATPWRLPSAPAHLSDEAKREWRRTGRRLMKLGLLTELDIAEFAVYCQSWGRWCEAEENLRRFTAVIMTPNKMLMQSPWLTIANRAMADMSRALSNFGMTPAARTRVASEKPPERDEFSEMFET
jgi:P27 family predicted phage terminase small subunit